MYVVFAFGIELVFHKRRNFYIQRNRFLGDMLVIKVDSNNNVIHIATIILVKCVDACLQTVPFFNDLDDTNVDLYGELGILSFP